MVNFVNQIDSIVVSEELVCLPKSAVLNADSETLATWKPASYEAMYEAHEKKDKIEWAEAVPAYKLNAAKDKDITLTVTQCCQKKDKAKDGSFDSCHKETSAKVKYEIK